MFDTTIPQSQVVQGNPVPNPVVNVLIRTADKADATNTTGQLGRMYEFARIMDNTAFVSKSSVAVLATARAASLIRKMFVAGSFDAMLQTLTYLQDPNFVGFNADKTMKGRFLVNSASKVYTLLPNLQSSISAFLADVESVYEPTDQIVQAIRSGTKNEAMVRTALVFQAPSLYESAKETFFLYHCIYLLCSSLNGFLALMEGEPQARSNIAYENLKAIADTFTNMMYRITVPVSRLWNAALQAAYDVDLPVPGFTQNLNAVVFMFERGTQDKFADYEALMLRQFRRLTDRRTPNWLTSMMAAQPVSADAVSYTEALTQKFVLDLKTLAYSREV